ncbi:Rv0361 family membrane protein [Blastococcus sp. SYSU D00820]
MSTDPGPYLYDDGPTSPHTGTPRSRRGLLVAIMGGTALVAVAAVVVLPLVKGTAEEQATAAVDVLLASLADGDTDTATQMLCLDERARLADDDLTGAYTRPGTPEVTGVREGEVDGDTVQQVTVVWSADGDEQTTTLTVVNEDGPRVCGIAPGA